MNIQGKPLAEFVCPGHPLLDAALSATLERHRNLFKQGTVLVDSDERSNEVRVLFYLEHTIQDGRMRSDGSQQVASRQMQFVEINSNKIVSTPGYAPYLDYRPIDEDEWPAVESMLEADWLSANLESEIKDYAVEHRVPAHLDEVKEHRETLVQKTMAAVKERLTKEIYHWDNRAYELRLQEESGNRMASLNAAQARQRADELQARLEKRMEELELERHISSMPPVVIGGALIVPQCLLDAAAEPEHPASAEVSQIDRERIDRLAVAAVMETERKLGREPTEMPHHHPGYDIESKDPNTNQLLFIEVKGKSPNAPTVTVSKTQIFTAFNKPDSFILAIVEVDGDTAKEPRYIRQPFQKEPDFGVTSVNYNLSELIARSEPPG